MDILDKKQLPGKYTQPLIYNFFSVLHRINAPQSKTSLTPNKKQGVVYLCYETIMFSRVIYARQRLRQEHLSVYLIPILLSHWQLHVHIVFEQNFVFPFFFHPSHAYYYSASLHQNTSRKLLTPHFFQIAFVTSSRYSKNTAHAIFLTHKYTTQGIIKRVEMILLDKMIATFSSTQFLSFNTKS